MPPLAEQEAVELFCARSQLEPDETIAELCRRLDDLPLAVELAAARTKRPHAGADPRAPLAAARPAEGRPRRRSAPADAASDDRVVRTSCSQHEEQQLFARLSVFAGGCTLEAAEEVADADLDTLQSLVEKSLLRFTDGRYWMLETIREYASGRLREGGEADDLGERHLPGCSR